MTYFFCRRTEGSTVSSILSTLSSIVLVIQLVFNISNANNNENKKNENNQNNNNNNNVQTYDNIIVSMNENMSSESMMMMLGRYKQQLLKTKITLCPKTFQTFEERVDKLEASDRRDAEAVGGRRGGAVARDSSHRACSCLTRTNLTCSLLVIPARWG